MDFTPFVDAAPARLTAAAVIASVQVARALDATLLNAPPGAGAS